MNDTLVQNLWNYLPNLLGATAILVVGVLVAWIVARLVRASVSKCGLGKGMLSCIVGDESDKKVSSDKLISQVVFWVLIFFVLAGVFEALRLPVISDPLINMLRTVFGYLPRLLAATGLVALAWVLATAVRSVIVNILGKSKLDEKINKELGESPGAVADKDISGRISLSRPLGDLTYWLIFLLFVPLVLDTLGLRGLFDPVQGMLNKTLAFLPNLFIAVLILLGGYFAAKIVSRIVTNILQTAGVNRLVGLKKEKNVATEQPQLAKFVGYVVFVLILMPIVIAALQALQLESITRPAEVMLGKFLTALPNLFAAAALLVIAYYVGRLLAEMVAGLLNSVGFDGLVARMGLTGAVKSDEEAPSTPSEKRSPSWVIGQAVLVVVLLFSTEAALRLIEFQGLANLLNQALVFLGHLALGLIVFGFGLYLGALVARWIRSSDLSNAKIFAPIAQAAIIILMGAMGLEQMGIGSDIIRLAFGLTLGAVAVAAAIAFGIGSRDLANKVVIKYLGHWAKEEDSTK